MQKNNKGTKQPICFKRWTRKAYGVFNSLHREIKIATLVLSYSMLVRPVTVKAQADTLRAAGEYQIETVEVPGQRGPGVYSQAARVVSVITRDEINAAPVSSIQDVIGYALNADVRTRGGNGVQADISVRGGTFDQVIVLLNGVNVSDPQTGHHALNLPVDISMIERVEVLNGPGARVYGSNAFTGAINIVTSAGNRNSVNAGIEGGDFGYLKSYANGSVKLGKTVQKIGFSGANSDGYTKNTDFRQLNAFYQVHTDFDANNSIDFQAGYGRKDFGALEFYTSQYPWQFEKTQTLYSSLRIKTGTFIKHNTNFYFRRHFDEFQLFREGDEYYTRQGNWWVSRSLNDSVNWYRAHNHHVTNVIGAGTTATLPWKFGSTSVGIDMRAEDIMSTNLGNVFADGPVTYGDDTLKYSREYLRNNASAYLEHVYTSGRFYASAGLMANWNSDLENDLNFYPGIDVGYRIFPSLKAIASYNKTLRMPTFTDLFYTSRFARGNPNLHPEELNTKEVGLVYNDKQIETRLVYFMSSGQDIIDWQYSGDTAYAKNISELTVHGVELGGVCRSNWYEQGRLLRTIRANFAYQDVRRHNPQPDGTTQALLDSKYALDNLTINFNLSVDFKIVWKLFATVRYAYRERQGVYAVYNKALTKNEYFAYDPVSLVDARLCVELRRLSLYSEASNLLNADYHDLGSVPQPGRWVKAGVSLHL